MKRFSTLYTKCKLKQWDTTAHLSEEPESRTSNIDKDMEPQELSLIFTENVQSLWMVIWQFLQN